ncbi:MAG TPA: hypothetical protein PKA33_14780 [Amaricoccus sp.]|uniref:hypothetical protein n=1 Tax=Amaricoccus sp. TaxID=1872485 RepID=UPI002C0D788A|nr:hypothetical protein [Amaricoccus sp.]HMQ93793.1 hypothetical protein [Amaricoccus sp.]HMR53525.1 hypothetical protein [Amaricoccus sp.]HMR60819.1 hypothetical protein [Amaricoccus sp.]HMU00615.1 hypothetical protein [Amaricoccus sp.]
MNKRFLTASAAALALALGAAAPGIAQQAQLSDSTQIGLSQLGFDVASVGVITADQAAQIENVMGSTDTDQTKAARIAAILGQPGDAAVPAKLGAQQLQDSVTADMNMLGITTTGVENLTLSELAEIENIVGSSADNASKTARIQEVMGRSEATTAGSWGVPQLQDSVTVEMNQLGIDSTGVDALTLDKLAEIEGVVNSSDDNDEKRARIERIMAE